MKKIFIANVDEYVSVDNEDYERVNFYKWHKSYAHDTHRVLTQLLGRKVTLPEFILNDQHAYQKVKNHDFTKKNLATDKYSFRYRKPQRNSSSKFKGVSYDKANNKWVASISVKGEKIHLGRYKDEIEGAKAYNNAVIRYWNGDGYLNEINDE
ncbi:TPA: AP2 domain-containing protein [Staphylococcus aureus]|nr:AP2 domain-containing protein [Staphylococcus aureus]